MSLVNAKLWDVQDDSVTIKEITPLNDTVFVIYGSRHDTTYKILSFKSDRSKSACESIQVGLKYSLQLRSVLEDLPGPPEVRTPQAKAILIQQIDAFGFHKNFIPFDKSIGLFDMFVAINLDGLCVIKNT